MVARKHALIRLLPGEKRCVFCKSKREENGGIALDIEGVVLYGNITNEGRAIRLESCGPLLNVRAFPS